MKKNKRRYQFPDGSNYPIVESSVGMILPVLERDVAAAEQHNPEACALAQCAIRIGAMKAFIAGTVAYVVMPYKGELVAMRFVIPQATQRAIKNFDETGVCPAEGFVLQKVNHTRKSENKKVYNDSRTLEQRRWTGRRGKKSGEQGDRDLRTYRHLTGQVHTTPDDGR